MHDSVSTRLRGKRKRVESSDLETKSPTNQQPKQVCDRKLKKKNTSKSPRPTDAAPKNGRTYLNRTQCEIKPDDYIEKLLASLMTRVKEDALRGINPVASHSDSFVHCMHELQLGRTLRRNHRKSLRQTVVADVSEMQLFRTASPFDRRCTALEWHQSNPQVVVVGSKGGDIIAWNINEVGSEIFFQGIGPGGSIQALKFYPRDNSRIMTASIDGTVTIHNLLTKQQQTFLDTINCHQNWFCSLDVSSKTDVVVAGDNLGNVILKTAKGETVMQQKLHRGKVTHIEYSPREEWLLASASVDQTVQLWDLRMIKGRDSALAILKHSKPVNSVYFSLTCGTRLLTTDQHSEIRVYDAPTFHCHKTIPHPHRQFQHMTQIKAFWHPLQDLIVVGRYPDDNFPGSSKDEPRTIDFFDADTGEMVCQLHDPQAKGIVSLNKFSPNGDYLASTMGMHIQIWSQPHDVEEKHAELMSAIKRIGVTPGGGSDNQTGRRRRASKQTKSTCEKKASQTKLKVKDNLKKKKR